MKLIKIFFRVKKIQHLGEEISKKQIHSVTVGNRTHIHSVGSKNSYYCAYENNLDFCSLAEIMKRHGVFTKGPSEHSITMHHLFDAQTAEYSPLCCRRFMHV